MDDSCVVFSDSSGNVPFYSIESLMSFLKPLKSCDESKKFLILHYIYSIYMYTLTSIFLFRVTINLSEMNNKNGKITTQK